MESLKDSHKYIVVNNKPKAVLLSCEEYETLVHNDEKNDWILYTDKNKQAYREAKQEILAWESLSLDQLKQKHATV